MLGRFVVVQSHGIQALLDILKRQDAPLFMKGLAAATVAILAWESINAKALAHAGGVEVLVSLLHDSMRAPPDIRIAASTAIASLANDAECRAILGRTAGVELLVRMCTYNIAV